MGIRVLVVDDNPHVRWRGQVYPVNATFHRFLAAFLDLPGTPVASIAHAVPLRELPDDAPAPMTLPLDPRIRTVATAPFDGIAGFLRHASAVARTNRPILDREVRNADLVWIKVPASNAALAAALAVQRHVPRFLWVAGTARRVAAGRFKGPVRALGTSIGFVYDAIGTVAGIGGLRVVVGKGLAHGEGVVASLLETQEIRVPDGRWPQEPDGLSLVWAGRVAEGKGLESLIDVVGHVPAIRDLTVLGDGPARAALAARAGTLGASDRVVWRGYVAHRQSYLDEIAAADAFVFPSPSEGFPKVILDAMAMGVPVIATSTGGISELVAAGLVEPVRANDRDALVRAIARLQARPDHNREVRLAAAAFASMHTRDAEGASVVRLWRVAFPALISD